MIDWSNINDIFGSAEDIPELLKELETTQDSEVLYELWDRLCHQGSVCEASFVALPYLVKIAEQWQPDERLLILSLAVSIISGEDIENLARPGKDNTNPTTKTRIDLDSPMRNHYLEEITTLLRLNKECLQLPNLSDTDFTYLLSNLIVLNGYVLWQNIFEYFALSSWGYIGYCTACNTEIEIGADDNDCAIAQIEIETDDNLNIKSLHYPKKLKTKKRTIIEPIKVEFLTGIPRSLYQISKDKGFDSVAQKVRYMLGKGVCPKCENKFQVPKLLQFSELTV